MKRNTMLQGYIDLHTHTTKSDGALKPHELIREAKKANISILAITDHDRMLPDEEFAKLEEMAGEGFHLLKGSEVSCRHWVEDKEVILHAVVIFPDKKQNLDAFKEVLKKNISMDRRLYIEAILEKLLGLGIDVGTYEELQKESPDGYVGRPQVGKKMAELGYTKSTEESMDIYIGNFGERRAWVENPNKKTIVTLKELVEVVHQCKGLIILAHLYYYQLSKEQNQVLLKDYAALTGLVGGMETKYGKYDQNQEKELGEFADEHGLFHSSGSDFHGVYGNDSLKHGFSPEIYDEMMERWETFYKE